LTHQTPKSDADAGGQSDAARLPSPKRGALPTPKSEIEKAPRYVIESARPEDDEGPSSSEDSVSKEKAGECSKKQETE
jgi:hypothetical protein